MKRIKVELLLADKSTQRLLKDALRQYGIEVLEGQPIRNRFHTAVVVQRPLLTEAQQRVLQALADYGSTSRIAPHFTSNHPR